ncbi:MAG: hypothetical protein IJ899_21330 [Blautia sp.]|nr:hypothetical protein [Blautia sp.]
MGKTKTKNTDGKIGAGKFFAWQTRGASAAVNFIILSFVTIYCTDALKMNPAVVGGGDQTGFRLDTAKAAPEAHSTKGQ